MSRNSVAETPAGSSPHANDIARRGISSFSKVSMSLLEKTRPSPRSVTNVDGHNQFSTLEIGRFVAALLVVLFHVDSSVHKFYGHHVAENFFRSGHAGVEYFFVLSGFIIFWVHRRDIGKTSRAFSFVKRRVIRIMPMYWLVLGAVALGYMLFPSLLQGRRFSLENYFQDLFLFPRQGEMLLSVAWTLRQEFIFYGLFLVAIIVPGMSVGLVVVWQCAIVLRILIGFQTDNAVLAAVLSTYNLGFGTGVAVAYIVQRRPPTRALLYLAAGSAMFVGVMITDWQLGRGLAQASLSLGEVVGPILYTLAATAIVLGCVSLEVRLPLGPTWLVTVLGGSSYLLYLSHGVVTSSAVRLLRHFVAPNLNPEVAFVILILLAVAAAVSAHMLIEKPILNYLRKRFTPK